MAQFVTDYYLWIKALHIIAVISWMSGMLYLPRLYVYHVSAKGDASEMLKIMERRLLRYIINPAMILSFILGGLLVYMHIEADTFKTAGWLHTKITLVVLLSAVHGYLARCRRKFANNQNTHSAKFYKILNEVPTVIMIAVVILAVVRPF